VNGFAIIASQARRAASARRMLRARLDQRASTGARLVSRAPRGVCRNYACPCTTVPSADSGGKRIARPPRASRRNLRRHTQMHRTPPGRRFLWGAANRGLAENLPKSVMGSTGPFASLLVGPSLPKEDGHSWPSAARPRRAGVPILLGKIVATAQIGSCPPGGCVDNRCVELYKTGTVCRRTHLRVAATPSRRRGRAAIRRRALRRPNDRLP
jgi:hypothetical protein